MTAVATVKMSSAAPTVPPSFRELWPDVWAAMEDNKRMREVSQATSLPAELCRIVAQHDVLTEVDTAAIAAAADRRGRDSGRYVQPRRACAWERLALFG